MVRSESPPPPGSTADGEAKTPKREVAERKVEQSVVLGGGAESGLAAFAARFGQIDPTREKVEEMPTARYAANGTVASADSGAGSDGVIRAQTQKNDGFDSDQQRDLHLLELAKNLREAGMSDEEVMPILEITDGQKATKMLGRDTHTDADRKAAVAKRIGVKLSDGSAEPKLVDAVGEAGYRVGDAVTPWLNEDLLREFNEDRLDRIDYAFVYWLGLESSASQGEVLEAIGAKRKELGLVDDDEWREYAQSSAWLTDEVKEHLKNGPFEQPLENVDYSHLPPPPDLVEEVPDEKSFLNIESGLRWFSGVSLANMIGEQFGVGDASNIKATLASVVAVKALKFFNKAERFAGRMAVAWGALGGTAVGLAMSEALSAGYTERSNVITGAIGAGLGAAFGGRKRTESETQKNTEAGSGDAAGRLRNEDILTSPGAQGGARVSWEDARAALVNAEVLSVTRAGVSAQRLGESETEYAERLAREGGLKDAPRVRRGWRRTGAR